MKEEKIKVTELAITNGKEIIIRTDECVPPIKLYQLKLAIEDYINRPMYAIRDCCVEFDAGGKIVSITKKDLDFVIKELYPDLVNTTQQK